MCIRDRFLRSTGVPVKRILQMRSFDLEQYQDGLNQLEDYMRSHLETCQRICGQIQRQMANTHEILRLQQEPYRSEEVPFEKDVYKRQMAPCATSTRSTSSRSTTPIPLWSSPN